MVIYNSILNIIHDIQMMYELGISVLVLHIIFALYIHTLDYFLALILILNW